MKHLKHLLYFIFAFNLVFYSSSLFAQEEEITLSKLSAADESRYREILAKPIDKSWLNKEKIQLFRQKHAASIMLSENAGKEENLLE